MQASGLDRNRSPLNYYTWVGVFFLTLTLIVGAIYVATIKIDYVWRWYRMPGYFVNHESVPVISDHAGTVKAIAKEGDKAMVTVLEDDGQSSHSYEIPGADVWSKRGTPSTPATLWGPSRSGVRVCWPRGCGSPSR